MTTPTEIIPGVFIGDQFTAKNFEFFEKNRIRRVVNCTPDVPFYFPWVQYYRIALNDNADWNNNKIMAQHLIPAVKFVLSNKPSKENGVLIHCHAGVSRSCTVGTALLRVCCAKTVDMAAAMLVSKRPIAFFNGTRMNFQSALYTVFGK